MATNDPDDKGDEKRAELSEGGSLSHGAHVVNQDLDEDYDEEAGGRGAANDD